MLHEDIPFAIGPLRARFCPDTGYLRDLRYDGRPVLQAVYAAVRDADWDTVPFRVDHLSTNQDKKNAPAFRLSVSFRSTHPSIVYRTTIVISASCESAFEAPAPVRVVFDYHGVAESAFLRNRIGICLLVPAKPFSGREVSVRHTDRSSHAARWPGPIAPHQPFFDIADLRYGDSTVDCTVSFEGDVFECEDQRNWTDVSYKIYSTPLDLPKPVAVRPGDRVNQRVTITIRPAAHSGAKGTDVWDAEHHAPAAPAKPDSQRAGGDRETPAARLGPALPLPAVGHRLAPLPTTTPDGSTTFALPSSDAVRRGLPAAGAFVHMELRPADESRSDRLRRFAFAAAGKAAVLTVALPPTVHKAPSDATAAEIAGALGDAGLWPPGGGTDAQAPTSLAVLLVSEEALTTPPELARGVLPALRRRLAGVPLGVGTRGNFTEINREPPAAEAAEFVAFSPVTGVHAWDETSHLENLQGVGWVVENARAVYPNRRIALLNCGFRKQFNPVASAGTDAPIDAPTADPRQDTIFAACYALGFVCSATAAGVDLLGLFDLLGPNGVCDAAGGPFPVGLVLERLNARPASRLRLVESLPVGLHAALLDSPAGSAGSRLVAANAGPDERRIPVEEPLRDVLARSASASEGPVLVLSEEAYREGRVAACGGCGDWNAFWTVVRPALVFDGTSLKMPRQSILSWDVATAVP